MSREHSLLLFLIFSFIVITINSQKMPHSSLMMNLHFYGPQTDNIFSSFTSDCGCKHKKSQFQNYWILKFIDGQYYDISTYVEPQSITFQFNGNPIKFSYSLDENNMNIKLNENIKKSKSQEQLDIENAFLSCTKYQFDDDTFLMMDGNGKLRVGFIKQQETQGKGIRNSNNGNNNVNNENNGNNGNNGNDGNKKVQEQTSYYVPTPAKTQTFPLPSFKRDWKVIKINNHSVHFDASISDSKVQYKYCNQKVWVYFSQTDGSFKAVQQKIPIMMNCTNMNPTEAEVDQAFKSISQYKVIKTQLHFFNSKNELLIVFESKDFVAQKSSIAKIWTTVLVDDISAIIMVKITDDFIQFTYQNEITMPYRLDGDEIEIGLGWPGILTAASTIYPSEKHILTAFTRSKYYIFSSSNLVFFDKDDNVMVKFKAGNHSSYNQNIPTLDGSWQCYTVNNSNLPFRMNISNNIIQYVYSAKKVMQFSINSNLIHLSSPQYVDAAFKHTTPNHWDTVIDNIFNTVISYRLTTNQLQLFNKDNTVVMNFLRPDPNNCLTRNKGVLDPKNQRY